MSPKMPRNISGSDLIKLFGKYGYEIVRQKGSHIRLSRTTENETHHLTIPNHNPLRLGTLNSILSDASVQLQISKEELVSKL